MSKVNQHRGKEAVMHPSSSLETPKCTSKDSKNFRTKLKLIFNLSRTQIIAGAAFLGLSLHSYEAHAFFGTILETIRKFTGDFTKLCFAGIVITLIVQITMLAFRKMNNPMYLAWPIAAGVLLSVLTEVTNYFWK